MGWRRSRVRQRYILSRMTAVARSLIISSTGWWWRRQRQRPAGTPGWMLRRWLELGPGLTWQVSRGHVTARYKLRGTVQMRRCHHRRLLYRLSAVSHLWRSRFSRGSRFFNSLLARNLECPLSGYISGYTALLHFYTHAKSSWSLLIQRARTVHPRKTHMHLRLLMLSDFRKFPEIHFLVSLYNKNALSSIC